MKRLLTILLLLAVLLFGQSVNGARRWVSIGGIQFQHIQQRTIVNAKAGGTLVAGITVYGIKAVYRL